MFSWKPIYIELAQKLLAYRDQQGQLLTWLHEMREAGLPAISVTDFKPKGTAIKLAEIDPFTFFSNFNRGIKNEHRVEILRILKNKMGLAAELPDDFDWRSTTGLSAIVYRVTKEKEKEQLAVWPFPLASLTVVPVFSSNL